MAYHRETCFSADSFSLGASMTASATTVLFLIKYG